MKAEKRHVLSVDLHWSDEKGEETATDATWGRLSVAVDGKPIWGQRTKHGLSGIHWAWIDMLEHLAEVWPWLEQQDGWPRGISLSMPRDFESVVRNRLADLASRRRLEVEQRFHEFRRRHDLSFALQ